MPVVLLGEVVVPVPPGAVSIPLAPGAVVVPVPPGAVVVPVVLPGEVVVPVVPPGEVVVPVVPVVPVPVGSVVVVLPVEPPVVPLPPGEVVVPALPGEVLPDWAEAESARGSVPRLTVTAPTRAALVKSESLIIVVPCYALIRVDGRLIRASAASARGARMRRSLNRLSFKRIVM